MFLASPVGTDIFLADESNVILGIFMGPQWMVESKCCSCLIHLGEEGKVPEVRCCQCFRKMRIAFSSVIAECLVKCSRITELNTDQVTERRWRARNCL